MLRNNNHFVLSVILILFSLFAFNHECYGQFDIKFSKKGGELFFFTESILSDSCYYIHNGVRFPLRPFIDDLWKIPLLEGNNDMHIHLFDIKKNENVYDTIVKYQPFGYWILSIGTGDKQPASSPRQPLYCSPEDANAFAEMIQQTLKPKPELCFCLTGINATKEKIMDAAKKIGDDIRSREENEFENEMVFIYLSGHGSKGKIRNGGDFLFHINDTSGYDSDILNYKEIVSLIDSISCNTNDLNVWLFVDACESEYLFFGNTIPEEGDPNIVVYSSVIREGDKFCQKLYSFSGDYCEDIKNYNYLMDVLEENKCKNSFLEKAVDGLFMNFLQRVLKESDSPIRYDKLHSSLQNHYNEYLCDYHTSRSVNYDNSPTIPKPSNVEPISDSTVLAKQYLKYREPSGFVDFSIGYNLSRQGNIQIGYSWPRLSAFVEFSGAWHWTDSITHMLEGVEEKMPSKRIGEFGAGIRHYPFSFSRLDVGYGVSVGAGYIYGEKEPSDLIQELKKDYQLYCSFTPVASLRFFTSKNHRFKLYFNVGYRFYLPCSINENIKWRSAVTSFGVSIPINK